jgi:hypothetical protein
VKVRLSNILDDLKPHHLDVCTIRLLHGRCPALSKSDRRDVRMYMEQKRIFSNVTDGHERKCLEKRLLAQKTIILSLRSWKDATTNYLRPGASILKPLFNLSFQKPRGRSSIQQEARASFRPVRVPAMRSSPASENDDFWDAYRKLWVAAVGYLLDAECKESGCATFNIHDMARIAYTLGFSSDTIRRHVCEAGLVSVDTGSGSVFSARQSSSRFVQTRSFKVPRHLKNLRASRDRLTFDQIYLTKAASEMEETTVEFETFRDALRSFFPHRPPMNGLLEGHGKPKSQSATFEPSTLGINALIEELKNDQLNDDLATPRETCYLPKPASWSTDSGSFYSRDTSGEAWSSTEAPDSRFSAGHRYTRLLLHNPQKDSGTSSNPNHGLLGVECKQTPESVQRAMCHANGTWIYHDTSPPMLYKLPPPPRARRIFLHDIVKREPSHWYAILGENGTFEKLSHDRAVELLGVKLIIYGESTSADPAPNAGILVRPLSYKLPEFPSSSKVTNQQYTWDWI